MPSGPRDVKELAAAAIACGTTVAVAADRAGVSQTTVFRWKRECPEFRERISELRSAAIAQALGLLSEGMAGAALALTSLVRSRDPDTKLRAAVQVLTLGLKLRDAAEFEARLQAVERALKGGSDGDADGTTDEAGASGTEPTDEANGGDGGALPERSDSADA